MNNNPSGKSRLIPLKIVGWCLVAISIIPILLSLVFYRDALHFLHTAGRAQGTVTRIVEKTDNHGLKIYSPIYQFRDSQGRRHEVQSLISWTPAEYDASSGTLVTSTSIEHWGSYTWVSASTEQKIGATVPILYKLDDPGDAEADTFENVWGSTRTIGVFGLVPLLIGLSMLLFARTIARAEPQPVVSRQSINTPSSQTKPPPLFTATISYRLPRNELIRVSYSQVLRRRHVILWMIFLLAVAAVFHFGYPVDKALSVALALLAFVMPVVFYARVVRAIDANPEYTSLHTLTFSSVGIVVVRPNHRSELAWNAFKSFSEDTAYFYLRLSKKGITAVLPKAAFTPQQQDKFRDYANAVLQRT